MSYLCSYAGIGSRSISIAEHLAIAKIGNLLSDMNMLLYSGNAPGADVAFQFASKNKCVIFLPWNGFEKDIYDYNCAVDHFVMGNSEKGLESVTKYHPRPDSLSTGGRALMARNYHQIHGVPPKYPQVKFVVCCADPALDGGVSGGTGQAVRIAQDIGLPIINIRVDGWKDALKNICTSIKNSN